MKIVFLAVNYGDILERAATIISTLKDMTVIATGLIGIYGA